MQTNRFSKWLCVNVTWRGRRKNEGPGVSGSDAATLISSAIGEYQASASGSTPPVPVSYVRIGDGEPVEGVEVPIPEPMKPMTTGHIAVDLFKPLVHYPHKKRFYFRGKKQQEQVNKTDDSECMSKTLFRFDRASVKYQVPKVRCFPCQRKIEDVDRDLLNELRLEVAFLPRSPLLLLQLKYKARKYLDQFDLSLYTMEDRYNMIMRAVTAAFLISEEEDRARVVLDAYTEREWMRPINNSFLSEGQTHPGGVGLTHRRSTGSVVRNYLVPRFMRNIRY